MRLDRFICKSTQLTKNQALASIHAGEVSVNNEIITNEVTQVHENNEIILQGEILKTRPFRYLLMHKPINTICSNVDEVYPSLINLLDIEKVSELHIAGRLDADTSGLVLISDDGRWTFNIISPSKQCPKIYRVGLSRPIAGEVAQKFEQGILLQGETELTLAAQLTILTPTEVLLCLTQGKFHQVKRMFAAVGNRVISLHRESIGAISLDVEPGQWRHLTHDEVKSFQ